MSKRAAAALFWIATSGVPAAAMQTPKDPGSWKLLATASNSIIFFGDNSGPRTRRRIVVYQLLGATGPGHQTEYRIDCAARTMRRVYTDVFDPGDGFNGTASPEAFAPADPTQGQDAAIFGKACEPPSDVAVGYFGADNRPAARLLALKHARNASPVKLPAYPTYPASPSRKAGVVPGRWAAVGQAPSLYYFIDAASGHREDAEVTFDLLSVYNGPAPDRAYDMTMLRLTADCDTRSMTPRTESRWLKGVPTGRVQRSEGTFEAPANSMFLGAIKAACNERAAIATDLADPEGWARYWFKARGY